MYNYYNYPDEYLMHYGVKGMKWGHRKRQAFSVSATKHRIAAKTYDINSKNNRNRALASSNAAARNQALKKAEKAQASANAKKEARNTPEAIAARKAKMKKAAIVGAAVAGTALAAYGAYKASKYLKSEAGKRSYESGKQYAKEHFFDKADRALNTGNTRAFTSYIESGRETLENTDKRTKKVSSSTIEAIKYLRHPEYYQVDGDLMRWH